jgi:hypothetical protein
MAEKKKKDLSLNLSREQLATARRRGGGKVTKTQRAKAGILTPIGQTRFEAGKGVVGPKGKAFTGSVLLPGGGSASYVRGRRLEASPAKPKKTTGGGTSPKTSSPSSGPSPKQRRLEANKGVAAGTVRKGAKGKTVRQYNAKTGRWGVVYTPGLNTTVRSDRPSTTRPKGPARTSATTRPSSAPKSGKQPLNLNPSKSAIGTWLQRRSKSTPKTKGYGRSGNKRYP